MDDLRIDHFDGLYQFAQAYRTGHWSFRGQSSLNWPLLPRIGRGDLDPRLEPRLLEFFLREAPAYLDRLPESPWEQIALARHHGLPTRLLDWTENALVAAFFACNERFDEDGALYAIKVRQRATDGESPFAIQTLMRYRPRYVTRRIAAQRGLFTVHPSPAEAIPLGYSADGIAIHRAIVTAAFKRKLLWNLSRFGINRASLFPDLDGLAAHITWFATGSDPSEEPIVQG